METNFCKHNQEHFQFMLQMGNFAATQGVGWVSQRLELWVASFPCPPRRVKWGCLLVLALSNFQRLLRKEGLSVRGLKTLSTSNSGFSQNNSISSKSDSS